MVSTWRRRAAAAVAWAVSATVCLQRAGDDLRAYGVRWNDKPIRPNSENYAKWDPAQRSLTKNYEEAEKILMHTGKMPRPLRMSAVKFAQEPLRKSIVASPKERRAVAEWAGMYTITRLQARLLLKRECHTIWGHERVLVFGTSLVQYLQPDADSREPMEMQYKLKFKCAFRENDDPFFPSREKQWNDELEKRGLRPDIIEGRTVADAVKGLNPLNDIPENVFCEAILDNVIDLGEVVLQHFMCHVDNLATEPAPAKATSRLQKRMQKRMTKEMGAKATITHNEIPGPPEADLSAQELHDMASRFQSGRRN